MNILKAGLEKVAIIDPSKKMGEPGQYVEMKGADPGSIGRAVAEARASGKEVRWYYTNIITSDNKGVPARVIVTEIPPGHTQPWHTHENIHEISIVEHGSIINVDAPETEDKNEILKRGKVLGPGDMVVETPKVRHTVANPFRESAVFITIQVANIPIEQFKIDWK